jgi:hypothetical protein
MADNPDSLASLQAQINTRLQEVLDEDEAIASTYLALESGMRSLMRELGIPINGSQDVTKYTRDRIFTALVAGTK